MEWVNALSAPYDGLAMAAASFGVCAGVFVLTSWLSPPLYPTSYASQPRFTQAHLNGKEGAVLTVEQSKSGRFVLLLDRGKKQVRVDGVEWIGTATPGTGLTIQKVDPKLDGTVQLSNGVSFRNPEGGTPERKLLWASTTVALMPTVFVPMFAIPAWLEMPDRYALVGPDNKNLRIAMGLSLGYMAFDTAVMLVWPREMKKALRPAFYQQMMYHHGLSILLWPAACVTHKCCQAVAYFMITELTNVFLNSRWFMKEQGWDNMFTLLWEIGLLIIYTALRIAPVPVLVNVLIQNDWSSFSLIERVASAFCVVPLGLNVFWYYLIMSAALGKVAGAIFPSGDKKAD